jgi:hypothetical protein
MEKRIENLYNIKDLINNSNIYKELVIKSPWLVIR